MMAEMLAKGMTIPEIMVQFTGKEIERANKLLK
jgi:hypothetical protein